MLSKRAKDLVNKHTSRYKVGILKTSLLQPQRTIESMGEPAVVGCNRRST